MKINDIQISPYSIPFKKPLITGNRTYSNRCGFIIKIVTDQTTGYGEAAPLPGFSPETANDCLRVLENCGKLLCDQLCDNGLNFITELIHKNTIDSPAARFGLETAIFDAAARNLKLPLAKFLNPDARYSVPVNFLYSNDSLLPLGINTIKYKVISTEISQEIKRIAELTEKFGDEIKFRLDLNGAWDLTNSIRFCQELENYNVDYIEQPLPANAFKELVELRNTTNIQIAVDESLTNLESAEIIIKCAGADVLIVKPMVSGGFTESQKIIKLARENKIRVIITSSLETKIGLLACLHLACANDINEPCGLLTGSFYQENPVESKLLHNGELYHPKRFGLGF